MASDPASQEVPICRMYVQSRCTHRNCKFLHPVDGKRVENAAPGRTTTVPASSATEPAALPPTSIPKPKSQQQQQQKAPPAALVVEGEEGGAQGPSGRARPNRNNGNRNDQTRGEPSLRSAVEAMQITAEKGTPKDNNGRQQQQPARSQPPQQQGNPQEERPATAPVEGAPSNNNNNNSKRSNKHRDSDYGGGKGGQSYPPGPGMSKLRVPRVNTEDFTPSHEPPTMRVVVDVNPRRLSIPLTVRDVLVVPSMFDPSEQFYQKITDEIQRTPPHRRGDLLKSWHGDSHWIADDSTGWKKDCPSFLQVVKRLTDYFQMDVKATRFNWYQDTSEWKPYHHDAAAVKMDKAKTQNFTVAVSFGATRMAAFEDAKTRTTIAMPQPDGMVYCFARDANILWRHGILQEKEVKKEGRISIILWGWITLQEWD